MGVYIKGMEMPKDDCAVYKRVVICDYFIDGEMKILAHDDITGVFIGEVIDVPEPHGRLIDADRLLTDRMKSMYYHLPNGDIAIPIIDIEHASTVIEGSDE